VKHQRHLLVLACLLALSACGKDQSTSADRAASGQAASAASDESAGIGVELDAESQTKLGVKIAPLEAAQYQKMLQGPGTVLDVRPIAQTMTDITTANAAVTASSAALKRAQGLYKAQASISQAALEAARRQAVADEATLALARTKARVAFGPDAPWLDASRRREILKQLTSGSAAIAKAAFPSGLDAANDMTLTIHKVGAAPTGQSWKVTTVWTGPSDPNVPGPTLFAYIKSAKGLSPGDHILAEIAQGAPNDGVTVPNSAVVIAGGQAWCYAVEEDNHFVRVPVDLDYAEGGGYFQAAGRNEALKPGAKIVIDGAGLLLARETGGGGGGEEDD